MKAYLEYTKGTSNKFWEVSQTGTKVITRWGRIGARGSSKVKVFATAASAKAAAEKQAAAKKKKGYTAAKKASTKKKRTVAKRKTKTKRKTAKKKRKATKKKRKAKKKRKTETKKKKKKKKNPNALRRTKSNIESGQIPPLAEIKKINRTTCWKHAAFIDCWGPPGHYMEYKEPMDEATYMIGFAYIKYGDPETALLFLDHHLELKPDSDKGRIQRASALMALGETEAANDTLAATGGKLDVRQLLALTEAFARGGNKKKMLSTFKKAIKKDDRERKGSYRMWDYGIRSLPLHNDAFKDFKDDEDLLTLCCWGHPDKRELVDLVTDEYRCVEAVATVDEYLEHSPKDEGLLRMKACALESLTSDLGEHQQYSIHAEDDPEGWGDTLAHYEEEFAKVKKALGA